jgi:PAS domain S-box-containing protein
MKILEYYHLIRRKDPAKLKGITIRFTALVLFLVLAVTTAFPLNIEAALPPLLTILLAGLLTNLMWFLWVVCGRGMQYRPYAATLADVLLVTWGIHYLGGIETHFEWLYVTVLIGTASVYGLTIGITSAVLSSLLYSSLLIAEFHGWIRSSDFNQILGNPTHDSRSFFYLKLVSDNLLFFVTALLSGIISEQLIRKKDALLKRNEEILEMQATLERYMNELERTVAERTAELTDANRLLRQEIEERSCVEAALKESEKKYRQVVENANEAIIIAQDGKLKFVNQKTVEIMGYSEEELKSRLFLEFIHTDDRELVVQNYLSRLKAESPPSAYDFRIINKAGEVKYAHINAVLIEWNGKPATLNFLYDITEQKRAEQELRESETRYRLLVDNSLTAICLIQDGTFHFVNTYLTEMSGYLREELEGMAVEHVIHPDDREFVRQAIVERLSGHEPSKRYQYRSLAKGGEVKWVEALGAVLTYRGRPAILVNSIDITERKRTEEALRKSEERYRLVAENVTDLIWTTDMEMRYTYISPSVTRLRGLSVEEALSESLDQTLTPDSLQLGMRVLAEELEIERRPDKDPARCRTLELEHRCKDGSTIWAEITMTFLRDPEGNPVGILGVTRDITKRRLAEQALKESEKRYRALVDNSLTGICIVWGDRCLFVNRRLAEMSEYSEQELLEMPFVNIVHPDDREFALQLAALRLSGEPPTVPHQYRGVTKSGKVLWVETFGTLIEYQGQPAVLVNLIDVTERKRAEELLRTSEEKYRTLFEESMDGVYISTPDGRILDINPAAVKLFGASSKEEMLKVNVIKQVYSNPDDRLKMMKIMSQKGYVKDYEMVMKRKDGQPINILVTATALYGENGEISAYRGFIRDITERKQLEQQLFQAQKMESIGTLAGGIAHDFNNLLGGILGYASFLKSKLSDGDPHFKYVDTIERSAMRAAELTSQLLGFARGGKYDAKPVNMNKVIEETLKIIGRTLDKSIEITTHLCEELPTVEADAAQMQQVLMNLFVNAGDAMPHGGKLIVETSTSVLGEDYVRTHLGSKPGKYVIVSVTDTGIGMDRETVKRIFEPFFTTKEKGKGTGLGLAMVYGAVKNHGGSIRVYSEPGAGTTFKVYLPAHGAPEHVEAPVTAVARGGEERVLVVDDEETIRSLVKDTLESYGYCVLVAENGEEAVRIYREMGERIDLVILDMVMPKMGGRETFQRLKELNPKVKALLSTGYSQNGKAQEILDSGVLGFLQKPYQTHELLSRLRTVLDTHL